MVCARACLNGWSRQWLNACNHSFVNSVSSVSDCIQDTVEQGGARRCNVSVHLCFTETCLSQRGGVLVNTLGSLSGSPLGSIRIPVWIPEDEAASRAEACLVDSGRNSPNAAALCFVMSFAELRVPSVPVWAKHACACFSRRRFASCRIWILARTLHWFFACLSKTHAIGKACSLA